MAGLIFIATPTTISDSELERRARDLGMVYRDEVFLFDSGTEEGSSPSEEEASSSGQGSDENKKQPVPEEKPVAQAEGNPASAVTVTITAGTSLNDIGQQLEQLQVVESKEEFLAEVARQGVSNKIVADTYEIPSGKSTAEVVRILTEQYRQ